MISGFPQRNPKGCQKVAGGLSPRRPPEKSLVMTAPRRGARRQVNVKDLHSEGSGTPPGCDPINLAFPAVSEDSDHRLLSGNPSGCAEVSPRLFAAKKFR